MQTPAAFEYERATSVEGAIASLAAARPRGAHHRGRPQPAADDEAAAGQPRAPDRHQRSRRSSPTSARTDGEIRIGALTRHVDLLKSELLAEHFPLFRDAEHVIADPVVRNRGTIGGSLCQADPAEDLSAVCTAVKAKVVIRGAGGERVVGMEDFHVGPVHDGGRRRRDADRGAADAAPRRRQRAREGRAPRRRLGDRRRLGGGLAGRRHDRRRRHRAQRGRADDHPPHPRRGAAARQGAVARSCSRRRARSPRRTARPARTAAGRSTTSATSPASSPNGHCAARRRARCSEEA